MAGTQVRIDIGYKLSLLVMINKIKNTVKVKVKKKIITNNLWHILRISGLQYQTGGSLNIF